jgi:tellurium resistance protein TerD
MTTNLTPGLAISLADQQPPPTDVVIGFGWDIIASNSPDPELVPMVLLLDEDEQVIDPDAVAFFNQLTAAAGAVQYVTGDDQEQVDIHLPAIPAAAQTLLFLLFINPDPRRAGTFRSVRRANANISTPDGNTLARVNVDTSTIENSDAVVIAELYRYKGQWKFRALGQGHTGGVHAIASTFGFTL